MDCNRAVWSVLYQSNVRALTLTLPLFVDTVQSEMTGTNWYQITYQGTMGY